MWFVSSGRRRQVAHHQIGQRRTCQEYFIILTFQRSCGHCTFEISGYDPLPENVSKACIGRRSEFVHFSSRCRKSDHKDLWRPWEFRHTEKGIAATFLAMELFTARMSAKVSQMSWVHQGSGLRLQFSWLVLNVCPQHFLAFSAMVCLRRTW